MSCQLGRVTGIESPNTIKQDGDVLRVGGEYAYDDPREATALAQQILGYPNVDEPVVPFRYSAEQAGGLLDGFYVVESTEIDYAKLAAGLFSWSATLSKVPGWQSPEMEVTRNGADRDNVHSITDGVGYTFLPGSLKVPRWQTAPSGSAAVPIENGSVIGYAGAVYDNAATYLVEPPDFYEGACTIEVSMDGGVTWTTVVGRQVPNLPGWVRIGNGRVRCTLSVVDGATVLTTEVWNGTGWESTAFNITDPPDVTATYTNANIIQPNSICSGPDGNLWFTTLGNRIGKITTAGAITLYTHANIDSPQDICSGPDGLLWFTSTGNDRIGKITTTGAVTTYTSANISNPVGICQGPDGLLWFTSAANDRIGKITTSGTVTTYTDANIDSPLDICQGPDGLLWFTSYNNDRIGKITTAGVVTTYSAGVGNAPYRICSGPDGLLWYTRYEDDAICKITTAGVVTTYTSGVPDGPWGIVSDGSALWFTYDAGVGKITTTGTVTTYPDGDVSKAAGIVVGPDSSIWFTAFDSNRIGAYDPTPPATATIEFGGTLTVLQNAVEVVGISVGADDGDETLDITLRRGANFFEGQVSGTSATYGIARTDSETGASVTGGITASAADANGNKFTLFSPATITKDTTGVSGISLTSEATTFPFAFSPVNEATVSGLATMKQAYFAAIRHRQRVVAR